MKLLLLAAVAFAARPTPVKRWISELEGADEKRQVLAARVLGRIGDRQAVPALVAKLDPRTAPQDVPAAAAEALTKLKDPRALDGILRTWDYVSSLKLGLGGELPSNMAALRANLVAACGAIGTERCRQVMAEGIQDSDPIVAQKAAWAFGSQRDARGIEAMLILCQRGGPPAKAAFEGLAAIGDSRGTTSLQSFLNAHDPATQMQAAYALARKDSAAKGRLLKAVADQGLPISIRVLAAVYLTRLGEKEGLDYLTRLLEKGQPADRERAIDGLVETGHEKAVAAVIEASQANEAATRKKAAQALGKLDGKKVPDTLRKLAEDKDPSVRNAAKLSLVEIGEDA